ncbi:MAG: FHA domain-containing protein [Candidatus Acidiferrales bacterium]
MPRIVIHKSGQGSQVFELVGDRPVTIGRAKSSNIVLDDPSVSRLHAVVRATISGKWQIVDRESSNGVKVNGAATKEAMLRGNDEITVGIFRLRFEDSAERNVVTYGTAKLPERVAKVLSEQARSAYTGSNLMVEAVGDAGSAESGRRMGAGARANAADKENRLLKLLDRVKNGLAELNSAERVTQRALDFALEIEGAERGYVMLLQEDSEKHIDFSQGGYVFQPAQIRYRTKPPEAGDALVPQLTISQSIIRQAMQASLPMLVTDGQADPRFAASKSVVRAGIQSAMCAPLGIGKKLRGLLYIDNLSRRGMFTVDDLNAFAVIAVQAGLAIDRSRGRGSRAAEKAGEKS